MLTGVSPYYHTERATLIENITSMRVAYPEELFPHVSSGAVTLLRVMLIRDTRQVVSPF